MPPVIDILLVRREMRGDVLLCSAIARALKLMNPNHRIYFQTKFPEVFDNNPRIDKADTEFKNVAFKKKYNLDLVMYEKMPGWHLIDGFAQGAGFNRGGCPRTIEMFPREDQIIQMGSVTERLGDYVVAAPGPGLWEGRNWPEAYWIELINRLLASGKKVVLVGVGKQYSRLPYTMDLRDLTPNFGLLSAVVKNAKAFVGIDSFPCHVAGAVKTPRVVMFGVTSPECILCDSPNTIAISSDPKHKLTGIRHTVNTMMHVNIKTPADNPMVTVPVDRVYESVMSLL